MNGVLMKVAIKGVVSIAIILLASAGIYGQPEPANEIRIVSVWGGLGKPDTGKLTIIRKSNDYYVKEKKIDSASVRKFLEAVEEPPVLAPDLLNLGITQEWLDANAESGVREYASFHFDSGAANQKGLYYSTFKNIEVIRRLLPGVLSGGWTDDYPNVDVEILWANGLRTLVSSDIQPRFMLPWQINQDGKTVETYNANISRSLGALLPPRFTNRERIAGEGLATRLAATVMRHIEKDWKRLDAENQAALPLATLKERFQIVSTEINPYHDSDYGRAWNNYKNFETNLHAVLRKKDFPDGFAIKLILPFRDGKADNLDLFLSSIEQYQQRLESIPWLWQHIRS